LRNDGRAATATGITARLRVLDTLATVISENDLLKFSDIPPDTAVPSSNNKWIKFSDQFTGVADTVRFAIEIASQGYTFWYDTTMRVVVNLGHDQVEIPRTTELHQNFPNPFNPITTIAYQLSRVSQVDLSVFNILGQKVATLVSEKQKAGNYKVEWDATGFASGVYLYRLSTDKDYVQTKKLVFLK